MDRNPRRRVEGNRVIYAGVLNAHDNAVLQCVATNDHGSVLANAALKVIGLSLFSLSHGTEVTELAARYRIWRRLLKGPGNYSDIFKKEFFGDVY